MNPTSITFPPVPPTLRLNRSDMTAATELGAASDELRLSVAWEKLHRARALLEVEQGQLCREREALALARVALQTRENELAEREAAAHAIEERVLAAPAQSAKPKMLFGFTRAPFGFGKPTPE
ncbi:MAG: hypothetical protein IT582_06240 [Opitutaceae bacterium]|nr:hypothetical protein [Opitutaceae bacterium]